MRDDVDDQTIPSAKFFGKGDPLYVQAQQIWIILTGLIMARRHLEHDRTLQRQLPDLTYYKDLAVLMGKPGAQNTLSRQLGIVGYYCVLNDLPPLNVVVVNETTEMPGHDVVVRPGRKLEEEMKEVVDYNWYRVRIPTTGAFRKIYELMNRGAI